MNALDDDVVIHLPQNTGQAMRKVRACESKVRERTGRLPSNQEIAEGTGLTTRQVREHRRDNHLLHTVSLDAPFSDEDGGASLHDTLSIPSHEDGVLNAADLKYRISKVLELLNHKGIPKKLQPILHEIVSRAYGLDGSPPQSVEEIAKAMEIKYSLTESYLRTAKHWMANKASTLEWAS